jgi:palmitoyl-protein thioesterase
MAEYKSSSVFLPALNNENSQGIVGNKFAAFKKERFSDLNKVMLIKFEDDTMIYPKETAWFQTLDEEGKVLPLEKSDFYTKDYIGLKALTDAGKVQYVAFPGNHLQFS